MSGFFFCGMIDEPVDHASSSTAQPNSREAHRQISSPSRDRCTPTIAATKRNSATKSRSLTASMELAIARVEAQLGGDRLRVERQGGAGQRAGAHAATSAARPSQSARRSRSRPKACACLASSCPNDTGWACCRWVKPGADLSTWASAWSSQRVDQVDQRRRDRPGLVAQVEPQVGGDLVVAAAPGAQLAAQSGPSSSSRPRSIAVCTSSSSGVATKRAVGDARRPACRARPATRACSSSSSSPARCSTPACARVWSRS